MRLGEIYLRGEAVTQDAAEAYQWLVLASSGPALLPPAQQPGHARTARVGRIAADRLTGASSACIRLAGKCRDGSGVPQDDVLARRFLDMAESRGQARPASAQAAPSRGDDCLFVIVRPSLRNAVRVAAAEASPPLVIRFDSDPVPSAASAVWN